MASQMQCPHHYKNAKVEIAGENFGEFLKTVGNAVHFMRGAPALRIMDLGGRHR
jgi:hypothetical protein